MLLRAPPLAANALEHERHEPRRDRRYVSRRESGFQPAGRCQRRGAAGQVSMCARTSAVGSRSPPRSLRRAQSHPCRSLQQLPQPPFGSIQVCLHRADRNIQRLGERLILHALQIVRRDQQAVVLRQLRDRLVEALAQFEVSKCGIVPSPARERASSRALPPSAGCAPAYRRSRRCEKSRWRVARRRGNTAAHDIP